MCRGTQEIEKWAPTTASSSQEGIITLRKIKPPPLSLFATSSLSWRVTSITCSRVLQQQYSRAYRCMQNNRGRLTSKELPKRREELREVEDAVSNATMRVSSSLPRRYLVADGGRANELNRRRRKCANIGCTQFLWSIFASRIISNTEYFCNETA